MDLWLTGTPTNGFQTQYSPSLSYFNAIRHHLVFTGLKSPSFFFPENIFGTQTNREKEILKGKNFEV